MNLTELQYHKPVYQLKEQGVLLETDGDPILTELFDPKTWDTFLKKVLFEDETHVYYVYFRVGSVVLFYFYNKERSIRDLFLSCKDYCIARYPLYKYNEENLEITDCIKSTKEEKIEFANEHGPLEDTYYKPEIFSDYANNQAIKLLPKK